MTFGLDMQVLDADATGCIWTLTSDRGKSRKRAGRALQRERTDLARARRREEANVKYVHCALAVLFKTHACLSVLKGAGN